MSNPRPLSTAPQAPHGDAPYAAVTETHTGIVFFVGDRAYKLKKPVRYGFVDFTSREARQRACQREVVLNRRLAADVYLGVADVTRPDDGSPSDHLVVMRRLPTGRALSALLLSGHDVAPDMERVATTLAHFHREATRSAACDREATRDAMAARWEANAREMSRFVGSVLPSEVHDQVLTSARRFLAGRARLFAERIEAGRACDGHGDLLADDVFCLEDGPRILDCLEFDDRLRFGDALGDVASLAMDVERLGRLDVAEFFIAQYQQASGDEWPTSLGHHYIAYRAQVRALVAALRSEQGSAASGEEARELLALCARHLEKGRVRMVVIGGLPGTGKSTLARAVGQALGAVVLSSDVLRKETAGLDPELPASAQDRASLYTAQTVAATYDQLLALATHHLARGGSVVLDATFTEPRFREGARRVAEGAAADLDELRCEASPAVIEARLAARSAAPTGASDATVAVGKAMAEKAGPWPEALGVSTDAPLPEVLDCVLEALGVGARGR